MSAKYADHDWEELDDAAMDAAKVLGYTQEMWDNDEEPEEIEDADWDDLTEEQKKAATVLGYNKKMWDSAE